MIQLLITIIPNSPPLEIANRINEQLEALHKRGDISEYILELGEYRAIVSTITLMAKEPKPKENR